MLIGDDGWCDGHQAEGAAARAWAAQLPGDWDQIVTLWWVATGELQLDPAYLDAARWPEPVREALTGG